MVATVIFLTTTGAGTWTVPADWNNASNSFEVIGGGSSGHNNANPGGGGGYSIKNNVTLTPGASIPFSVGVGGTQPSVGNPALDGGDTWIGNAVFGSAFCAAKGSTAPTSGAAGIGGAAASGIGDTCYSGGNGGTTAGAGRGGAGGAGGPFGNGADGGSVTGLTSGGGGGGGGGSPGGVGGASTPGGAGGNNHAGTGGGAGGIGFPTTTTPAQAGTNGGGGGGGQRSAVGAVGASGGPGNEWLSTLGAVAGSGGGGGGSAGNAGQQGGDGGLYGGGGANGVSGAVGRPGAQGIIVITYTPGGAPDITGTLGATLTAGYIASFVGIVQPLPPVNQIDMHDGKAAEDHQADRDRAKKEAADNLRKAVRKAYRKTNGLAEEAPETIEPPADAKELARAIQAEIKTDGIVARLRDIQRIVAEYQAEMALRAQEAEADAVAILLLTGDI